MYNGSSTLMVLFKKITIPGFIKHFETVILWNCCGCSIDDFCFTPTCLNESEYTQIFLIQGVGEEQLVLYSL